MIYKQNLRAFCATLAVGAVLTASAGTGVLAQSGAGKTGTAGLPVPRFVSLKADEVNVRQGPGWDHAVTWVFRRAGLPIEVLAEFESWRQVRDSEGATGWVFSTLLSNRRTSLVTPGKKSGESIQLREKPSESAGILAKLESGLLVNVKSCNGQWCNVTVNNANGWISQNVLWGVYPDEVIE